MVSYLFKLQVDHVTRTVLVKQFYKTLTIKYDTIGEYEILI